MGSEYSPNSEAQHQFTFSNKADYTSPNALQLPSTWRVTTNKCMLYSLVSLHHCLIFKLLGLSLTQLTQVAFIAVGNTIYWRRPRDIRKLHLTPQTRKRQQWPPELWPCVTFYCTNTLCQQNPGTEALKSRAEWKYVVVCAWHCVHACCDNVRVKPAVTDKASLFLFAQCLN